MPQTFRVVVVEDNHDLQFLYRFKLENEGFHVMVAREGQEALAVIERHRPHIILLDLILPGMSGAEVLAHLREQDWASDMRVIVLTNLSKNEAPAALRFLGVNRYIVKAHHTPSEVIRIVHEVLNSG